MTRNTFELNEIREYVSQTNYVFQDRDRETDQLAERVAEFAASGDEVAGWLEIGLSLLGYSLLPRRYKDRAAVVAAFEAEADGETWDADDLAEWRAWLAQSDFALYRRVTETSEWASDTLRTGMLEAAGGGRTGADGMARRRWEELVRAWASDRAEGTDRMLRQRSLYY